MILLMYMGIIIVPWLEHLRSWVPVYSLKTPQSAAQAGQFFLCLILLDSELKMKKAKCYGKSSPPFVESQRNLPTTTILKDTL